MIQLRGSVEFLLLLSNIYEGIIERRNIDVSDFIKFRTMVEDSIEYKDGNHCKSIYILLKYLEKFQELNLDKLSFEEILKFIATMLHQINDNLYPINIQYYINKFRVSLMVGKETDLGEALNLVKAWKNSCTVDVDIDEQIQCRARLLKIYLLCASGENLQEISILSGELKNLIKQREKDSFNNNIF